MLHLALAPLLNGTLLITMHESNVALFLEIVKIKKHIGAFTLLTKTTKHIFDTNLTIVQIKILGGKNTQIPITVIRGVREREGVPQRQREEE